MNNWLRRLGVGRTRDRVDDDGERLAQGGEFHVKQPDESPTDSAFSSDEGSASSSGELSESRHADTERASAQPTPNDLDPDGEDPSTSDPTELVTSSPAEGPDADGTEVGTTVGGEEAGPESPPAAEEAQSTVSAPAADRSAAADDATAVISEDTRRAEPTRASGTDDDSPIAREIADLTARRRALEEADVQLTGRTRVLTISNQKGGVGKTTTAVNLAAALAERGARVLVIDLDPQGNASTALGVPHGTDTPSVYDVLIDEFPLSDIIQVSPESPNLLCAPSTIHLAGAEIELVSQVAREHRLRAAVDAFLASNTEQLDFILIDCPPSLGLLTINAFTAATELLIPIQCEYYALEGLSQLLGTVRMIQKHLNPSLQLSTIMLTMYDGRTRLAQQVADEVREHFPNEVLDTIIPRSVRVSEAPSFGQTVLAYDGQSAGAIAYREAAVEMIRRDSASIERRA